MNRGFDEEDVELRIDDLMLYCLEHWKSIVISMLVFALVAGGIGAFRAMNVHESLTRTKSQKSAVALEALEEENPEEIAKLDRTAHRIALYKQLIQGKEQYLADSVLMNLDSSNVVTEQLQYMVSTTSGNMNNASIQQQNLQLIVKSYESRLANDELYRSAGQYLGVDSAYVRELVAASDYFPQGTNVYLSAAGNGDEDIVNSAILYISVKGSSVEYCDSIANYVKRRIESIGEDLNNIATPYTIKLINSTVTTGVDNTIVTTKTDALNLIKTIETNITAIEKDLGSDEKAYVEAKSEEELETLLAKMETDESEATEEPEESAEEIKKTVNPVNKKFIAIGAVLGIFLAAGFWLLRYILSSRLVSVFALEDRYGVKTYALVQGAESYKGLSGFFRKIRYRKTHFYSCEELAKIFKAEIETLSEIKEVTKVFVASTENFEGSNDAFIAALKNEIGGSGIEISSGVKIKYDPDMIISTSNADVVIVLENVGKSSNFEIDEEMRFISERKTQVIGAVVQ